jgi:hypothetical protein
MAIPFGFATGLAETWSFSSAEIAWRASQLIESLQFRLCAFGSGWQAPVRLGDFGWAADYHPPPPTSPSHPRRRARMWRTAPAPCALPASVAANPGSRRHRGRRAARLLLRTSVAGVAVASVLALTFATAGFLRGPAVRDKFAVYQADARAIEYFDQHRRLGVQRQPGNRTGMAVLPSETVPNDFFQIFEALENPDSPYPWRSFLGVDPFSSLIGGGCMVARKIRLWNRTCRGASTLEMQAARGWSGSYGGRSNGDVRKQAGYMLDAASISLLFDRDSAEFKRFVADALTYGTAYGGFEMHGVRNASLLLFGAEPDFPGLSDEERLARHAILAAMPLHRISWSCDPNWKPTGKQAEERRLIKIRAVDGLRAAFPGSKRAEGAIAIVKAMHLPEHPLPIDPVLTAGLDARRACLAAADPARRLDLVAGPETIAARREIDAMGEMASGRITGVRLTTDAGRQASFRSDIRRSLVALDGDPTAGLLKRVGGGEAEADVVALRTEEGAITGLYTGAMRPILDEARRTGSIGKMVIAVAAARAGHSESELLCQKRDRRTHLVESNGFAGMDSCAPGSGPTIEEAFGKSQNLSLLDLARKIDERLLRDVAAEMGFRLPDGIEPAYALVTGMCEASPRQILAMEDAIARAVAGRPALAPLPYIVEAVRVDGQWIQPTRTMLDLRRFIPDARARDFLRAAGAGALASFGTLRTPAMRSARLKGEIAKTGTVAGPRPGLLTRAKLAVGGVGGHRAWFAMIAAPSGMVGKKELSVIGFISEARAQGLHGLTLDTIDALLDEGDRSAAVDPGND